MNIKFLRVAIASTVLLLLLSQIFSATSEDPGANILGVNTNDSFVFQITDFENPIAPPSLFIGPDKVTGEDIMVQLFANYTLTVTDSTVTTDLFGESVIQIAMDNGTHSINMDNPISPGKFYISSTNWTHWLVNMTVDPFAYWGSEFLNQTLVDGALEFEATVFLANVVEYLPGEFTTLLLSSHFRYDRFTGVLNEGSSRIYENLDLGFPNIYMRFQRYGWIEPVASTTNTATTTTSNTTTTTTTTTPTIPPPTSSTIVTPPPTSNTSTPIDTSVSNTAPPTNTSTVSDASTTDPVNPTDYLSGGSGTSSPSTRTLATTTTGTTFSRNSTAASSSSSPADDSSTTPTLPVPGFGLIISFTAFITTITLIKYRKH